MPHLSKPSNRRSLLAAATACACLAALSPAYGQATDFPNQPIRIVVPFTPGGTTDLLARLVAEGLRQQLGQPVLIDNKPGAGGNLGAAEVARARPNGYTLLLATPGPLAINQYTYANPGYDAEKQFVAVTNIAMVPNVLMASTQSGITSLAGLVAAAKASPGRLNYGSAGNGSTSHLAFELFKARAGVSVTHIPYRGVAPAMNDLMGGQIELMFDNLPTAMPMIESGKVIALGVSVPTRVSSLPQVPPISDTLPGYELGSWFGLVAPAGTPDAVIHKISAAVRDFVQQESTSARIVKLGSIPQGSTPESFAALIKSEQARFRDVVKRANIRAD